MKKTRKILGNKRVKIICLVILSVLLVWFLYSFSQACQRVGHFTVTTEKESTTWMERLACKFEGYELYTHQELIDKGFIFTDEKNEALKIAKIVEPLVSLKDYDDNKSTLTKIQQCEDIKKSLESEKSSDKVNTDKLNNFVDDCIKYTDLWKYELETIDDTTTYNNYLNQKDQMLKILNYDLEGLDCKI